MVRVGVGKRLGLRTLQMAAEWARELSKFKGPELLIAEIAAWGFAEVERGRNPDVVLKEVLTKITDRIPKPN